MSQSLFSSKINFHREKFKYNQSNQIKPLPNWWTPLWRGLIADPNSKHRKAMGAALWLYLYLLAYSNRKTGIVRRNQRAIVQDTGYPLRTIQFNLNKLRQKGYLTTERQGRYLKIQITKWKSFTNKKNNDS